MFGYLLTVEITEEGNIPRANSWPRGAFHLLKEQYTYVYANREQIVLKATNQRRSCQNPTNMKISTKNQNFDFYLNNTKLFEQKTTRNFL